MNMHEATNLTTHNLRGSQRKYVDMRRYTSWRAGGLAERMYQPADLADLQVFLASLPAGELVLPVGLGSNLLVRDGGLRGTVLLLHAALTELRLEQDGAIYAQSGVPGAKLARFAARHNLRGAEFFAGIPGTVGGMLTMNAGCYGGETWIVVERVQTVDRKGVLHERTPAEYEIGYRNVELKDEKGEGRREKGVDVSLPPSLFPLPLEIFLPQEIFVGAWFRLPKGDGEVSRREIRELLSKRISSQPLNLPNAGSVFRNPAKDHAARLIEVCGLKGKKIGGAQVSEKHANFIVNVDHATAADIENLIAEVRKTVQEKTGIALHPEVRIVGEPITGLNSIRDGHTDK
jgi:UDP-N-acetylmuramate dehydrogenase